MDKEKYHQQLQADLISLIRVLDECMDDIDGFYAKAMKKRLLCTSTNN